MGLGATNKIGSETNHDWGRIAKSDKATKKQDETIDREPDLLEQAAPLLTIRQAFPPAPNRSLILRQIERK